MGSVVFISLQQSPLSLCWLQAMLAALHAGPGVVKARRRAVVALREDLYARNLAVSGGQWGATLVGEREHYLQSTTCIVDPLILHPRSPLAQALRRLLDEPAVAHRRRITTNRLAPRR